MRSEKVFILRASHFFVLQFWPHAFIDFMGFGINILCRKAERCICKEFYCPPVSEWWPLLGSFLLFWSNTWTNNRFRTNNTGPITIFMTFWNYVLAEKALTYEWELCYIPLFLKWWKFFGPFSAVTVNRLISLKINFPSSPLSWVERWGWVFVLCGTPQVRTPAYLLLIVSTI